MRATILSLGALILLGAGATLAQAGPYYFGPPQAPDACGPGWYNVGPQGMVYGPNYWLRPPYLPWNGLVPAPSGGQGASPAFPTHPYARGPRDYFMTYDNWYDLGYLRGYFR
jgi:hypothetical protein